MEFSELSSDTKSEPKSVAATENRKLPLVETFLEAAENIVIPKGRCIPPGKPFSLPVQEPMLIPEAQIIQIDPERKCAENTAPIEKQLGPAHKKDLLICDRCGEFFKNTHNLEMHQRRHTGVKNYACTRCGMRFINSYLLKLHERVRHLGEQPYACKFCDKRFLTCTARGQHEKVNHYPAQKYECNECDNTFKTKTALNRHKFLHTGQKPFRCEVCNLNFSRRYTLNQHNDSTSHYRKATSLVDSQMALIDD